MRFRKLSMYDTLTALNNISLTINEGEKVGIIGPNGAGKTTLLKVISGIYKPYSGTITVSGRVAPIIDITAGFNPELTGRENIFLYGAILGFSRKEILERLDDIIDFSELHEFINTPVKYYSNGMYLRLAFSIAVSMEADIVLIDEVLSVGDEHFKAKAQHKLKEMLEKSKIVIFVSHSMEEIMSICNRVILLNKGRILLDGSPEEVVNYYINEFVKEDVNAVPTT